MFYSGQQDGWKRGRGRIPVWGGSNRYDRMTQEKLTGDLEWDGLHRPQIYYAVISTFCGLFLPVLDGTICNVALPTIALELGISPSDSIWIVNAFQLVIMMLLLPFASLIQEGISDGRSRIHCRVACLLTFPVFPYPCRITCASGYRSGYDNECQYIA